MPTRVVNVIPQFASNEVNFDSEPNVAVNPAAPRQIVLTAFTPDTTPGATTGPYYFSSDGGVTWAINSVVPGGTATFGTGDISVRFGPATGTLYAGILRADTSLQLNILRKANFAGPGVMTVLVSRASDDQPWVEASMGWDAIGVLRDHVYVSSNDISQRPNGRTASVDLSLDPATAPAPAGFTTARLEQRASAALPVPPGGSQDGPSVRTAIHRAGTVYGAFLGWRTFASPNITDVVVVRDDNWGQGGAPFTALTDPGDGLSGRRVVTGVSVASLGSFLGTQRIGSSLSLEVDPRNRRRVYLAWCDGLATAAAPYTLHVRRSDDGGITWTADLRTIPRATNPALAVTTRGVVGLLYQQLDTVAGVARWRTHLEISNDRLATVAQNLVLADVRDSSVGSLISVIIGDYCDVVASGKDLFGAFSAFNEPVSANFPAGVTYLRNANFTTNALRNVANTANVNASVDPFFVHWSPLELWQDFYVRDWTDSPTSGDDGLEPSLRPAFYVTSDVWNRRGTNPGTFPNDQPANEDAGNGAGTVGDNFAFARIRRRGAAPAGTAVATVSAHFLVSPLGTGSNFLDATSFDPDVTFTGPDPTTTFAAGDLGPAIVGPLGWHLNPVASTHLCLAVEITAPNDPMAGQSLRGRAPGWPDQDLEVLEDNNKAQRNMGLSTTPARGLELSVFILFAIIHNASLRRRDVIVQLAPDSHVLRAGKDARLSVVGSKQVAKLGGGPLVLKAMEPGENRWVALQLPVADGKVGEGARLLAYESVDGQAVNGFGLGFVRGTVPAAVRHAVERHRSVFTRLSLILEDAGAAREAKAATTLLRRFPKRPTAMHFLKGLGARLDAVEASVELLRKHRGDDAFGVAAELATLRKRIAAGAGPDALVAQVALLERLDAALTELQLRTGNRGDILQTVAWQRDLVTGDSRLAKLKGAEAIAKACEEFAVGWASRSLHEADYPPLVERLLPLLATLAAAAKVEASRQLEAMKERLADVTALQGAHRDLLLALQEKAR